MSDFHETEGKVAAVAGDPGAEASDAEILTRRTTDEQVERAERGRALQEVVGCHVAEVHRIREARGKHGRWELLDLGAPDPIELRTAEFRRANAGEAGCSLHTPTPSISGGSRRHTGTTFSRLSP